jgi:translation elongation factor EF-1alpha
MITAMEERIGSIIKFFDKNSVAAIKLEFGDLSVGDSIRIKGPETDFTQKVAAMEFDHKPIEKALRGQFAGIKLDKHAKPFDLVFRISG